MGRHTQPGAGDPSTEKAGTMWKNLKPLLGLVLRFLSCCVVIVSVFLVEKLVLGTRLVAFAVFAVLAVYLVRVAGRHIRL